MEQLHTEVRSPAWMRMGGHGPPLEVEVELPTLHDDQVRAFLMPARFKAIRCGRRWGKTLFGETVAADTAIRGHNVGWFAPAQKFLSEAYNDMLTMLAPVVWRASQNKGVIRLRTGGRLDFWTLDNPNAGRSRHYHLVVLDECAFTKPMMLDTWRKSIRPTLLDYRGRALALSNTNGIDDANFFYQICNNKEHGFVEYHAPTRNNPFMPADELAELQRTSHPLVYQQEYLADFIDWSGASFFSQESLLDANLKPVPYPVVCDLVFATIDTAVKDKNKHDGTAVCYWASSPFHGVPLTILDYDIVQIEGALLETWLPSVYQRLDQLSGQCRARRGSAGVLIEDKASGTILLQQARKRNWKAHAIESKLTELGKSARAINISGYVHRDMVKISDVAYDRQIRYKGNTRNHLLAQLVSFRPGIDNGEDDLLDTFTYGVAIALGDSKGF